MCLLTRKLQIKRSRSCSSGTAAGAEKPKIPFALEAFEVIGSAPATFMMSSGTRPQGVCPRTGRIHGCSRIPSWLYALAIEKLVGRRKKQSALLDTGVHTRGVGLFL